MDLELNLEPFAPEASVEMKKDEGYVKVELKMCGLDFECGGKFSNIDDQSDYVGLNGEMDDGDERSVGKDMLNRGGIWKVDKEGLASTYDNDLLRLNGKVEDGNGKGIGTNVLYVGGIRSVDEEGRVSDDDTASTTDAFLVVDKVPDSAARKEDGCSIKRKQGCASRILNWINMVAKDPCDPVIGSLPECSKWKFYTSSHIWKQVLLVREAMTSRKNVDSNDQQWSWQKKQKMHPTMYDDHNVLERLRCSQRILSAKECSRKNILELSSSSTQIDEDPVSDPPEPAEDTVYLANVPRQAKVLIGRHFQADMADWTGDPYKGDSKWLGARIWPSEKVGQYKNLIEREPMGKGRQDSCGCPIPGSMECVKFHVSEKRMRLRLELGPVFYQWRFESMGEDAVFSWTKAEEKIFYDTMKSNPLSHGCFWDEIVKSLPNKSKKSLVNFYFNVFLLLHRGDQNRSTPEDINSDDEEPNNVSESAIQPGSIFCSPKKAKLKS